MKLGQYVVFAHKARGLRMKTLQAREKCGRSNTDFMTFLITLQPPMAQLLSRSLLVHESSASQCIPVMWHGAVSEKAYLGIIWASFMPITRCHCGSPPKQPAQQSLLAILETTFGRYWFHWSQSSVGSPISILS